VTERLKARDVEVTDASWDSWRTEGRPWTVVLTFAAGGRQRQASWTYDLADRTVSAVDDEARWLSEEVRETKGPIPAPRPRHPSGRQTKVYDVEAEGGLHPADHAETQDDPLDLMTAMRRRSTAKGRRKPGTRAASGGHKPATSVAKVEEHARPTDDREQTQPTDDPEHDLAALPPQTGAHTSPDPSPVVADHSHADHGHPDHTRADHSQHQRPEDEQSVAATGRGDEGSSTGDSAPHTKSPHATSPHAKAHHEQTHQSSPDPDDETQEPDENSARQDQSTARPKRPARESARKAGRPSVPAWDEIMFGAKSGVDRS